jgi:hypothetical protein
MGRSININIDLDYDELIWSMSKREKIEFYERLKPEVEDEDSGDITPHTQTEVELYDICDKIYKNRNSLTNEDKSILIKLSKKGWYDEV